MCWERGANVSDGLIWKNDFHMSYKTKAALPNENICREGFTWHTLIFHLLIVGLIAITFTSVHLKASAAVLAFAVSMNDTRVSGDDNGILAKLVRDGIVCKASTHIETYLK